MDMYTVNRHFFGDDKAPGRKLTVKRKLTLQQAQEHCNDKEASSRTAVSEDARRRTRRYGPWFDGYEKE
jgi:hypothetical protein